MRAFINVLRGAVVVFLLCGLSAPRTYAADAYPLFTDVNVGPQNFGVSAGSFGGLFIPDDTASLNGNAVLAINQNGSLACCHGALIEVSISNGENGVTETAPPGHPGTPAGTPNLDPDNTEPPNAVFAAIGNPSGRLENGNVIRFSAWFRSDPANPITLDPQVQPILKIEYWKQALSDYADTNMAQLFPQFGDRVFDQDQQGTVVPIPDLPHWVDINGDGIVNDGSATVGNGRVTQITTTEWRLAEVTHTVNSADWFGIGADAFGADDITAIESVKAVMFMGDFAQTDLTGDGADGGNLLIDNVLIEVFKEAASVTPNMNPNPSLSEGVQGDYNGNGTVDAADYVLWRKDPAAFGGDPDGYNTWRANFGNPPGAGSGVGAAVPEPATWILVAAMGAMIVPVNRRRCAIYVFFFGKPWSRIRSEAGMET